MGKGLRDREAERQIAFVIARNIRHILAERRLSQADLARMTRMQEPTINRHLVVDDTPDGRKFQRCPTVHLLLRYCDALVAPKHNRHAAPAVCQKHIIWQRQSWKGVDPAAHTRW